MLVANRNLLTVDLSFIIIIEICPYIVEKMKILKVVFLFSLNSNFITSSLYKKDVMFSLCKKIFM